MSALGPYNDTPYKITNEGCQITITLTKVNDNQITVNWTLPSNTTGCSLPPDAYNGIIIVLDTTDIGMDQTPVDNKTYIADPTANVNLFAGDNIGTGLVVGAFYNDKKTNSLTITGINPNAAYFVAGFAVDNVNRYHREGVRTYSQVLGSPQKGTNTHGYQAINLGVTATSVTGLNTAITYPFSMMIDSVRYNWKFTGTQVDTFGNLIDAIQTQISNIDTPHVTISAPNTGNFYFDNTNYTMYQWDGMYNIAQPTIVSSEPGNSPIVGVTYWLDSTSNVLNFWGGSTWTIPNITYYTHPINQLQCDDVWFNGVKVYIWDNTIWNLKDTIISSIDPTSPIDLPCHTYWYNSVANTLNVWGSTTDCTTRITSNAWNTVSAILHDVNPVTPAVGDYWYDETNSKLFIRDDTTAWVVPTSVVFTSSDIPVRFTTGSLWFNPDTDVLQQFNGSTWVDRTVIAWRTDPTLVTSGTLWWNTLLARLSIWNPLLNNWTLVTSFIMGSVDPSLPPNLTVSSAWYNPISKILNLWDGSRWNVSAFIYSTGVPSVESGDILYNTTTKTYSQWDGMSWQLLLPLESAVNPNASIDGTFWFNPSTNVIRVYDSTRPIINRWVQATPYAVYPITTPVGIPLYSVVPLAPTNGYLWYNPTTATLQQWNTKSNHWVEVQPRATIVLQPATGNILITSTSTGSVSNIVVPDFLDTNINLNNVNTSLWIDNTVNTDFNLFSKTAPKGQTQPFVKGADSISGVPLYKQLGVGTDGTPDERRDLINNVLLSLGYPTVQVELTKEQLDFCVDTALSSFRKYSASAYERAFFFMNFEPGVQQYFLTDKTVGLNRIVRVQSINRQTSAFVGTGQGQGMYGQMVMQQLYQMGSYDMISYSMMSDYVELLEIMFATRVVFRFNENTRRLDVFQNIGRSERVVMDVTVERTEQSLISDRMVSKWLLNWTTAEACVVLANTRGKFGSLPGAGGAVSLNASDLRAQADSLFEKCQKEIEDFIVSEPEVFGMESTMIIG